MDPTAADALIHIRHIARRHFENANGSHDWDHTLRVVELCRRIGPAEGADMLVLEAAALLHDIGRPMQDRSNGTVCHADRGARMAVEILNALNLPASQKNNIIHCVQSHRFRSASPPQSIEARVLFDADKLDAIGAVGVARAYLFAGELGACLHNPDVAPEESVPYSKDDTGYREFKVKLAGIKDRMLTAEGRRLALGRHRFMLSFFERFLEEYQGRC